LAKTSWPQFREGNMHALWESFRRHAVKLLIGLWLFGGPLAFTPAEAAMPDPEVAGYVAVEGGRIWYRLNGAEHFAAGKMPLLVIHGGPGFSHHYLLTLTDLADERPVILYDQLDSGNSERPGDPTNWTVERFVDEVDHVRNALGLDQLVVLGSSWGGSVAASYAIRQPPGLVGLVLASPLISTERWIADNTEYREQLPEQTQKILDKHEAAGTTDSAEYQEAVMEFYTRHLNRMDPWPEELNRAFELANLDLYVTMWGNTEFNATGTLKDFDVSGDLGQIDVPMLMICGEYDEATPDACRDFAAKVPDARVEIVEDASHTGHLEQRETFLAKLRAFLASLEQ
jgi:L-proline amide hydrolase